jgi:hypothetical protein
VQSAAISITRQATILLNLISGISLSLSSLYNPIKSVPHQVLKADQKQKSMQNEWQQGRDPHTIFLTPYFAFVDHIYDFGFFSILLEDDEMISSPS